MLQRLRRSFRRLLRRRKQPAAVVEYSESIVRELRARGARIGEGCRIYSRDFSTEPYLVTIGNRVGIAGGVKIITHNGAARLLKSRRPHIQSFGRVDVGDDSFVGENALLLPGTSIGRHCIIGAGAVVRGPIPDDSVVVGNPAKVAGKTSAYLKVLDRSSQTLDTFHLPEEQRRQVILSAFGELTAVGDGNPPDDTAG